MAGEHEGLSPSATTQTRRKADTWDRIKILLLLGIVTAAILGTRVNSPFSTLSESIREFLSEPIGWVLATLMAWEIIRQIHYLISERSAGYHSFWQQGVFGGLERGASHFKPWTRFRVRRFVRWIVYVVIYAYGADYLMTSVESPVQAIVESPRILVGALFNEFTIRMFLFLFIAIGQFVAIFWFLSRGGTDVILPEEIKTRFKDVWGQDHVLDLIKENIAFLEKPDAIEAKGGYIPGGILLWGPPGTGKTLIAEAIAGETGRPFVFIEPGAFLNMFFGVGVLKVKGLYRKLRKLSLRHGGVIAFFDEADSLGSRGGTGSPVGAFHRGPLAGQQLGCNGYSYLSPLGQRYVGEHLGLTETNREEPRRRIRDRIIMGGMGGGGMGTLQALLTEMNGLTKPRGLTNRIRKILGFRPKPPPKYRILHIMATNMPEALDPAMLRPGRIDRIYKVGFPSKEGRKATLEGYLAKVKHELNPEQVEKLATVTPYYSGARIKDLVNEALILAIRAGRESILWDHIWKAKVLKELGPPEDVDYIQRERHAVAVHEASHAVAAHLLGAHRSIDMVTIEKRATTLGMVSSIKPEDRYTQWRTEFETDTMVSLASLAGERMLFSGDNSSGVSGDMTSATTLVALMEGAWGMGSGLPSYQGTMEGPTGAPAFPVSVALSKRYEQIDTRLKELYQRSCELLEEHRDKVLAVAAALEERKTISGDDVTAIMGSAPGSRTLRQPTGWNTIDEEAAHARIKAALDKLASDDVSPDGHREKDKEESESLEAETT